MEFSVLAEAFEKIEATTKRLEMMDYLVKLFKATPPDLIDKVVYLTQGKLYPDYLGMPELGVADKLAMRAISRISGRSISEVEDAYKRLGDLGSAAEELLKKKAQLLFFTQPLTVERVYATLDKIAKASGPGSIQQKVSLLAGLLADASPREAKYIIRIVTGRLRLGVADMTVLDALAQAFTGSRDNRPILERAYNLCSDLGAVAKAVATGGLEAVKQFKIELGRPIRCMLAERLPTPEEIIKKLGKASAEWKMDGLRMQIHKDGDKIVIFSRRLENLTEQFPDAVELARTHIKPKQAIVECEACAIDPDTGDLLPFQELMHRRRKYGIEEAAKEYPVALYMFDVLYVDGRDVTTEPYIERRKLLEQIIIQDDWVKVIPNIITDDPEELEKFFQEAVQLGCEGLMVKDLKAPYRAGAREFSWIKLKREYQAELTDTIDLVIIGGYHGRGRRAGKYGAFLLAAYDPENDVFKATTKVGTGFTDEDLEKFKELLDPLRIPHKHPRVVSLTEPDVWFVPKIVIEVIAAEITLSPTYPCGMDAIRKGSGLALRFPKFTGRIRFDKAPEDATTEKELIEMYRNQLRKITE
ncbi:MAG TPA: ATP-dependent DNA ligase [Candidatus Bathyarchaeota archaeon]|nr:ATP-dependent DNA ligase [Candidatus Bathyarchaeota archaeon]